MFTSKWLNGVVVALWVFCVMYVVHGAVLIENFNDFVGQEQSAFMELSESHDAAYSTLLYCQHNEIDYIGCKIEIQKRFTALGLEVPVADIFHAIESLDEKLNQEKQSLFSNYPSVQLASIFYAW